MFLEIRDQKATFVKFYLQMEREEEINIVRGREEQGKRQRGDWDHMENMHFVHQINVLWNNDVSRLRVAYTIHLQLFPFALIPYL